MRETWAIIVDAYRDLNSRRIIGVVLLFSALLAAIFALVGLTPGGFSILGYHIASDFNSTWMKPAAFYKWMFLAFGIQIWLQWPAAGLAILSTAGMFPELVSSGSIDLYLSRPIGRLRLFLVKYLCGLIFVAFQVAAWCLAAFIVIGLRGGDWEPGVFLAVPLMILFYSYLHCFSVLVGVLTRSTITAIVGTLIFWIIISFAHAGEAGLVGGMAIQQQRYDQSQNLITGLERELDRARIAATQPAVASTLPATAPSTRGRQASPTGLAAYLPRFLRPFFTPQPNSQATEAAIQARLDQAESELADRRTSLAQVTRIHNILYRVMTVLPKTVETVDLLERVVVERAGLTEAQRINEVANGANDFRQQRREASAATTETLRSRSVTWVVGTSLVFEAVILSLAAWIFCRRDY